MICDHLDVSSIHYGIDVPQFHCDGFHTFGTDFDDYKFMTIVKNWDKEDNDEFKNKFQNEERTLKSRVTESRIS